MHVESVQMIAVSKRAGVLLPGLLVIALAGCTAGEPAAPVVDHAQTVQRDAGTPHIAARPVDVASPAAVETMPEAIEATRAAGGASVQLRKVDAAAPSVPAEPVQQEP